MLTVLLLPFRRFGLLALVLAGCVGPFSSSDEIEIRVANRTDIDFGRVSVAFPLQTVEYGVVRSGGVSPYADVEQAYGYARVEVLAGQETLVFQPIDFMGATLLEPGRYTYALTLSEIPGSLEIDLERD